MCATGSAAARAALRNLPRRHALGKALVLNPSPQAVYACERSQECWALTVACFRYSLRYR